MFSILGRIRTNYRDGFQIGYSAGRSAVAHQALTDVNLASPGSLAARDWLNDLVMLASREAHAAGQRPPPPANLCRSQPRQIIDAAGPGAGPLRQGAGHTATLPDALARSAGVADGRTAARWITGTDLYAAAAEKLATLALLVNGVDARSWLHDAQRRWFAAAAGGSSPLAGTAAAGIHRNLALRIGNLDEAMRAQHPWPRRPATAQAAARPAPGSAATAGHRQAGARPGAAGTPAPAPKAPPQAPSRGR